MATPGRSWETGFPPSKCKKEKQTQSGGGIGELGCGGRRRTLGNKSRVLESLFLWGWAGYKKMKLEKIVPKVCHVNGILDFNPESIRIYRSTSGKQKRMISSTF